MASDASLFSFAWCRPFGAAPHTHQDQGSLTSRPEDQTPAPGIVDAPEHRRFPAVSTRVSRTHDWRLFSGPVLRWLTAEASPDATSTWGGQMSWVEARTNHTHGCAPFGLPVSHPNPHGGSTSAKSSINIKGRQVSHDIKTGPGQCMGHGFASHHPMVLGRLPLVKSLYLRTKADGKLCRLHRGPLKIGVAIFDIPLAFTDNSIVYKGL